MMDTAAGSSIPVLEVEGLEHRIQDRQGNDLFVLHADKRIVIHPGRFVAILGPSGCGKTTLLSILGLLRRPFRPGEIGTFRISGSTDDGEVETHDVAKLWQGNRQSQIERLRRELIGFALQSGDLLGSLTVRENIAVPLRLNGAAPGQWRERVNHLLEAFSVDEDDGSSTDKASETPHLDLCLLADRRINKISGGQYQRVVLARAIAHRPRIAFVDEPTSALNRELARTALEQLKTSCYEGEMPGAVIMITHDETLAEEFADVIIRMKPEAEKVGRRKIAAGRVVEVIDRSRTPSREEEQR